MLRGLKDVRSRPSRPWVSDESVSECRHLARKTKGTSMAKISVRPLRRPGRRISEQLSARRSAESRDAIRTARRSRRPSAIDFQPGQLLGSVSGELGLRKFLEAAGHQLVVTSDKDGPDSAFERELVDADVVISQPFWPAT